MYGYWPAGGIDSHGKGATDHSETETPDRIGASIHRLNTLLVSYSFPLDTRKFTNPGIASRISPVVSHLQLLYTSNEIMLNFALPNYIASDAFNKISQARIWLSTEIRHTISATTIFIRKTQL